MKKILLLSAVLLGAVSASQAGIRFNLGFPLPPLPLPPLPGIVIGRPAPTYVAPPVCAPPAPVYRPAYGCDTPVVVGPPSISFGFGYPDCYRPYGGYYRGWGGYHRGWDGY